MSIQLLSAELFRQKLAGLVDPDQAIPEQDREGVKEIAVRFVSILASLFGDSLDRKTLWERIGNGIVVCCAKCGGDWETFVNQILEYIKADGGRVASSKNLEAIIKELLEKPQSYREAWLRVLEAKHFLIIVKARALWNSQKGAPKEHEVIESIAPDGFVNELPGEAIV